jgi:hypothetical protein
MIRARSRAGPVGRSTGEGFACSSILSSSWSSFPRSTASTSSWDIGILCIYRWFGWGSSGTKQAGSIGGALKKAASIAFFSLLTYYGWLVFRAVSVEQIAQFTEILLTGWSEGSLSMKRPTLAAICGLPLLAVYEMIEYRSGGAHFYSRLPRPLRGGLYAAITLVLLMGTSNEPAQFIYFQF